MTKHSSFVILNYFIACSGQYDQRSAKFPCCSPWISNDTTFLRKGDIAQSKLFYKARFKWKDSKNCICSNSDCLFCTLQHDDVVILDVPLLKWAKLDMMYDLIVIVAMAIYAIFVQKLSSKFHISYAFKYDSISTFLAFVCSPVPTND